MLDLPNTAYTSRRPAAIAASAAIAKAFRDRDESHEPDEEAETTPTKRVKKVGFTKESKAEIFNDSPPTLTPPTFTPSTITPSASSSSPNVKMTEVRARAARHKGQMNFEAEITQALYAYGDDKEPLPETVRVLDEIVTDFIIETCFTAAKSAECCGRSKLKVDDFKFAIRGDPALLGRVNELLAMDKHINTARKAFKTDEGREGLERGGRKKKSEGKDGEEKVEGKGVKVEDKGEGKVEEELGDDLDDEDME